MLVEEIEAKKLAAKLRWSQHRILMTCATGLRDCAGKGMGLGPMSSSVTRDEME